MRSLLGKIIVSLMLFSFLISTTGCATLTGLITGPFTGAYSLGHETYELAEEQGDDKPASWAFLYGIYGFFLGAPLAIYKGFDADLGFLKEKHYNGSEKHPGFNEVFYPFNFNHVD
jgi:hypothetical protein